MTTMSPNDFARRALELGRAILPHLRARFPGTETEEVEDAVEDAIIDAVRNRQRLRQPSRGWLYYAAWRNVRDRAASIRARREREQFWVVESRLNGLVVYDPAIRSENAERVKLVVNRIREQLPENEKVVLSLLLDGVRDTEVYASALGISQLSTSRRHSEVARIKDRVRKRLRRNHSIAVAAATLLE